MRTLFCLTLIAVAFPLSADEPQPQRTPVQGKISKLNSPGTITVSINIGSDDGVKRFDTCDVYRDHKPIGRIRVTELAADHSTAEIRLVHETLKAGDQVLIDPTLQFLRSLTPNSVVKSPAELGRKFAEADIRQDIKRIFHFGKPWSNGKPLVDDVTGYPVTVTAGCLITNEFATTIREYNATMRKHFQKK